MIALYICLALCGGLGLGYCWREIKELSRKIIDLEKAPLKPAVTLGSYHPANESRQSSAVITPKTPMQMEALEAERRKKEVLGMT